MNQERRVIIFSTVWPEPQSSAAGVRQMQWVHFFLRQNFKVTLSSPSKLKAESDWGSLELPEGVECLPLPMNQESVKEDLKRLNPDIVMFDRFILEEQFGHWVYEACPDALTLLETQDLHFVRRARDSAKEKFLTYTESELHSKKFYHTDTAIRETASILRVDYAYVISSFEEALLQREFELGHERVQWVPMSYAQPLVSASFLKHYEERDAFVWVGNFRHGPNIDGLRWFRNEIWPRIRVRLPGAQLKIFGAYPSEEVMQWNRPQDGVEVKGSAQTLDEVFLNARVNLAPLRYGAGVKGKILEGFRYGVPCVTTKIGVEGILPLDQPYEFPGLEANTVQSFAEACVALYHQPSQWDDFRSATIPLMNEVYSLDRTERALAGQIEFLLSEKKLGHLPKWNSRVLRHELQNSHKYFARWIEAKSRNPIRF